MSAFQDGQAGHSRAPAVHHVDKFSGVGAEFTHAVHHVVARRGHLCWQHVVRQGSEHVAVRGHCALHPVPESVAHLRQRIEEGQAVGVVDFDSLVETSHIKEVASGLEIGKHLSGCCGRLRCVAHEVPSFRKARHEVLGQAHAAHFEHVVRGDFDPVSVARGERTERVQERQPVGVVELHAAVKAGDVLQVAFR